MSDKSINQRENLAWLLMLGAILATAFLLYTQGRVLICVQNDFSPIVFSAWNSHTSQHLFDPYSLTHLLHGVMFYGILWLILPKIHWQWRLFLAILLECSWELLENSAFIINRYRTNTVSLDYFGDSIVNSIGDILACGFGFFIAHKIGWRFSAVMFLAFEILLLFTIRDSLLLNIIMLIYPLEGIKDWQNSLIH